MWGKISIALLCIIVLCQGIYIVILNHNSQSQVSAKIVNSPQLVEPNINSTSKLLELESELESLKIENGGLRYNLGDYLRFYDSFIAEASVILPVLQYSNEEEHQALLYARKFLQNNTYKEKLIISNNEIVIKLDIEKTDIPSIYAIYITTYQPQMTKLNQLPFPTDLRVGEYVAMNVKKVKNGWEVTGDISYIQ